MMSSFIITIYHRSIINFTNHDLSIKPLSTACLMWSRTAAFVVLFVNYIVSSSFAILFGGAGCIFNLTICKKLLHGIGAIVELILLGQFSHCNSCAVRHR